MRKLNPRHHMGKYLVYILIVITSIFIISQITVGIPTEPFVSSKTQESTIVTWEFESAKNYISDNITIRDNRVELDKIETTWTQNDLLDFQSGRFNNISITDDSNLKLSPTSESIVLDVNTERDGAYKINHNHSGYQTFKVGHSITISKIRFLGKIEGEVSGNLLISLQTKDGEPIAATSLSSTIFQHDINTLTANINSIIEANTTYRLFFESTINDGDFVLIGSSKLVHSEGAFHQLNDSVEEPGPEKEEESGEDNIELEIFGIEYFERGTFESEVFDAGGIVFWADVKWSSEILENVGKVQIFIRTGNSTKISHHSWTTWRLITSSDEHSSLNISAPSASYIQYKIILTTSDTFHTPIFEEISITLVKYYTSGSIETLDFILNKDSKVIIITNFSSSASPNGRIIEYFYSMDSGANWNLINANNFSIISNNQTGKIRFLVKLITDLGIVTPILDNISFEYSKFQIVPDPVENPLEDNDPTDEQGSEPMRLPPSSLLTIGVSAGLLGLAGYGLGTETGKYAFLRRLLFLLIPLYHKVDRDKILDHYLRKQIFKYIQANPGANYSEIMKATSVKNGVLVHHLNTLEREEMIKSSRDGVYYKRFYPMGVKLPPKEIDGLSWFQIGIFNLIRTNPGITPKKISEELGKNKQIINYHLKLMKKADLVRVEAKGKFSTLYVIYSEDNQIKPN